MSLVLRTLAGVGALALVLYGRPAMSEPFATFRPPHVVRAPAATLDDDVARRVNARIDGLHIGSVDDLMQLSLEMTSESLHFGLAHTTALTFRSKEREGNCIEYAHLFATIFNRGALRKHLAARAWVVHSDALVGGRKLAVPGLGDHDWVLVVPERGGPSARRLFVDPTFYDLGLGWNVAGSVAGNVQIP